MHTEITSDTIKHYGVKGMKWGVRRYQPYPKGQRNAGKFLDSSKQKGNQNGNKSNKVTKDSSFKDTAKATVRSKGREMSMVRAQKEIKNLSTSDAKKVVSRSQLENRLKRLNNTKNVGDGKSNRDYLNRASMSNKELKRKVDRLQLADNMRNEARNSNKELIDMGKKAAAYAAPLAIQFAVKKVQDSGRNFGPEGAETILSKENLDNASKKASKFIDNLI